MNIQQKINRTKIKINLELTVEQITCLESGLIALETVIKSNKAKGVPDTPEFTHDHMLKVIKETEHKLAPIEDIIEETLKPIRGW